MTSWISVASLPAIQRDLFLARALRRDEDAPSSVDTFEVRWADMCVAFASDAPTSAATVEVDPSISIVLFSRRLESLLDCGAPTPSSEWVIKYSVKISQYGGAAKLQRLLCDKVSSINPDGETVGVMKLKRRSVTAGYAKVRILPPEDSLQLVCRHQTSQGLKAVWKSVLWRLKPQHGTEVVPTLEECNDALLKIFRRQGWNFGTRWRMYQGGVCLGISCSTVRGRPLTLASASWDIGKEVKSGYGLESLFAELERPFKPVSHFDLLKLQFL